MTLRACACVLDDMTRTLTGVLTAILDSPKMSDPSITWEYDREQGAENPP